MDEYVHIMALCESAMIVVRPNELYKFVPVDGCSKCEEMVKVYE